MIRSSLTSALRRTAARALLGCAVSFAAGALHATPDARSAAEIDALLAFVAASECTFIRSGKEYDGAEARKHLAMKYRYARSRIQSADQFIRDVASASSMSGDPYQVRCGTVQEPARAWLEAELRRVRGQH